MELVIILIMAIVICAVSWLVYSLFRMSKDTTDACTLVASFWCVIALLAVIAFSYLLIVDSDWYSKQDVAYFLQGLFTEAFLCAAIFWIYGMSRDTYDEVQQEALQ